MLKYLLWITGAFCLTACVRQDSRDTKAPVLDEGMLRAWVNAVPNDNANAKQSLDSILHVVQQDSTLFTQTIAYLEKPLGYPNSPCRNEELYGKLLQAKLKSPFTDSIAKVVTREQLFLLMQNRVGEPANDFEYLTPVGSKKKMYSLKSDYLLLYFYNPECGACKEMKEALETSAVIARAIASGQLKVLAIYTDQDIALWEKHLPGMPAGWIQGRDEEEYLYQNKVYDLRAIPTLCLLDRNKKVILKDVLDIRLVEQGLGKVEGSVSFFPSPPRRGLFFPVMVSESRLRREEPNHLVVKMRLPSVRIVPPLASLVARSE